MAIAEEPQARPVEPEVVGVAGAQGTGPDEDLDLELAAAAGLYHDAVIWVFFAAFVGMVIASSTSTVPPWAGALIGGISTFFISALVLASRGR